MEKIANKGILTPLKVAGRKRLRFRYQDVMKLAVPIDPNTEKELINLVLNFMIKIDPKFEAENHPQMEDQYLSFSGCRKILRFWKP